MDPIRIEIMSASYRDCEVLDGTLPDLLLLYPDHMECRWRMNIKFKNSDDESKEGLYKGERTILKKFITSVEAIEDPELEGPCHVTVYVSGAGDHRVMLRSMQEARIIQKQIAGWLLSND